MSWRTVTWESSEFGWIGFFLDFSESFVGLVSF